MTPDDVGRCLHDKATRGVGLSAEEQAQLADWYSQQDAAESAALAGAAPAGALAELRAQVDSAAADLVAVTQRVQAVTAENESLRREIITLQLQLARRRTPPANCAE
jgi:hypothetical protein